MVSRIHDATTVNKGRKEWKTTAEIKKPYAADQYSQFIKDIEWADQCLSYYSVLNKTVKWSKRDSIVSAKLCAIQRIYFVQDTKYKLK